MPNDLNRAVAVRKISSKETGIRRKKSRLLRAKSPRSKAYMNGALPPDERGTSIAAVCSAKFRN
jgi:hypothetical protein